jgi:hypothetical protein
VRKQEKSPTINGGKIWPVVGERTNKSRESGSKRPDKQGTAARECETKKETRKHKPAISMKTSKRGHSMQKISDNITEHTDVNQKKSRASVWNQP